jgi:phosphoribosylformylglycinamidine synthase
MGWTNVSGVHVGRHIRLDVEAPNEDEARDQVAEIAKQLLSNPVIEDFRILETQGSTERA